MHSLVGLAFVARRKWFKGPWPLPDSIVQEAVPNRGKYRLYGGPADTTPLPTPSPVPEPISVVPPIAAHIRIDTNTHPPSMTSFASLMALSASHTRESQQAVETALQERRRKEAAQRRQQEEKEAREREQEKKMRMRRLEEEKRAQERELRLAEERRAREAAVQRREDAQRDSLRYGPKKAGKTAAGGAGGASSKWPASSSDARDAVRRRRMPDDDEPDAGPVLTREELRERKQQAEMRRLFSVSKRLAAPVRTHGKTGMRLPGGAMNIVTNRSGQAAADEAASSGGGSVKDRLAAKPNTLVQLNMKKRDKRTEDEIQMEVRANRKVLDGSEALQFTDWFSDKKKDKPSAKASPAPGVSSSSPPSRADTPASREWRARSVCSPCADVVQARLRLRPPPRRSGLIPARRSLPHRSTPRRRSTNRQAAYPVRAHRTPTPRPANFPK